MDSIFKKMGSEGWESRRVWLQRPGNCEQERTRPASAHINLGLRVIDAREYRTPGWLWEPKGWLFLTIVNLESQGCDLLSDNHQRPRKRTESGNWFKKKGKKLLSLCTVVFPLPFTKSNAETKTLNKLFHFYPPCKLLSICGQNSARQDNPDHLRWQRQYQHQRTAYVRPSRDRVNKHCNMKRPEGGSAGWNVLWQVASLGASPYSVDGW